MDRSNGKQQVNYHVNHSQNIKRHVIQKTLEVWEGEGALRGNRVVPSLLLFSFVCIAHILDGTCDAADERPGVVMAALMAPGPDPGPWRTSEPLLCSTDLQDLQTPSPWGAQDHSELWPAHGSGPGRD